jgi:hypothetical protein
LPDVFIPAREDLTRAFRDASAGEIVFAASEWTRSGNPRAALELCEAARGWGVADPALTLVEATARFALDQRGAALEAVARAVPARRSLMALHLEAHMLAAEGRKEESRARLASLIDECPDFPGAQALLSRLVLPGPPYRDVLSRLHHVLRPENYLEIGVESGATLALATTATRAVGVDPAPALSAALPANARLYPVESDRFFAEESRDTVFDGRPVDLAFIDGMHWFEYALRDFVNVEHWAAKDSTIVLHDCLPISSVAARRERASMFWVGDVWKVLDALLEYRPDLLIRVIPTPPSGLVVVRRLDPNSRVLRDNLDAIVTRYRETEYSMTPGRWPERYGLVSNDGEGVLRAVGK